MSTVPDHLQLPAHPLLHPTFRHDNRLTLTEEGRILYGPVDEDAYVYYYYPMNNQPHLQSWTQHAPYPTEAPIHLPRIRELGFRLGQHDLQAASMSMLSHTMEPGESNFQGDYGGEYEAYEDQRVSGWDADEHESEHEQGRTSNNGHEYEYHGGDHEGRDDRNIGSRAIDAEDTSEAGPTRWQKARKPRRPYTVTMALRKTNWFESSLEWEDEYFRVVYR